MKGFAPLSLSFFLCFSFSSFSYPTPVSAIPINSSTSWRPSQLNNSECESVPCWNRNILVEAIIHKQIRQEGNLGTVVVVMTFDGVLYGLRCLVTIKPLPEFLNIWCGCCSHREEFRKWWVKGMGEHRGRICYQQCRKFTKMLSKSSVRMFYISAM